MAQSHNAGLHRDHTGDPLDHGRKQCILCGRCLQVCPLFSATRREELSPRGKFFLAQSVSGNPSLSPRTAAELAGLCLSCGRCEQACPQGLCASDLAGEMRAAWPGWDAWVWKQWIGRASVLWPAAFALSALLPRGSGRLAGLARRLRGMLGQNRVRPWLAPKRFDPCGRGGKAVVFPGCVGAYARPDWTAKARAALAGLGFEAAAAPDWTCCGCTMGHAGLPEIQARMQLHNLAAWRAAGRPLVAVFCATCSWGLRAYASLDLGWEGAMEREQWLESFRPLAGLWGRTRFAALAGPPPRVMYHRPCHGSSDGQDQAWLEQALEGRLSPGTGRECCGLGGVLQLGAPGLSERVAQDCWASYGPEPGQAMVTGCSGCVLQLAATAPQGVAVGHWLDILRLA